MGKTKDLDTGLTFSRVDEVLSYDPLTGLFHWKIKIGDRAPVGKLSGGLNSSGHWRIRIDGRYYLAHRLAWLLMMGAWPAHEIDHKNRIRNDNRWSNLRAATHAQNCVNKSKRRSSRSGYKGVWFDTQKQKFIAVCVKDGRRHHAGFFDDVLIAHGAYCRKSAELHGEFHCGG